ncbi:MAG: hypothetical protein AAFP19_20730 [Bacteroidota bacterium]
MKSTFQLFIDYQLIDARPNERVLNRIRILVLAILMIIYWLDLVDDIAHWILLVAVVITFYIPNGQLDFFAGMKEIEHSKKDNGQVTFSVDGIQWKEEFLAWGEVRDMEISYSDIKGEPYSGGLGQNRDRRSAGVNNQLMIKTREEKVLESHFLIKDKEEVGALRQLLWQVVRVHPIPIELAKKLVQPGSYEKHQLLKLYCKQ